MAHVRRYCGMDQLAMVLVTLSCGLMFLPWMIVKPNRISAGEAVGLWQLLDQPWMWVLLSLWLVWAGISLYAHHRLARAAVALLALLGLLVALGMLAHGVAADKRMVRVTPAVAFWGLFAVFALSLTDALLRFALKPYQKLLFLFGFFVVIGVMLRCGLFDPLAMMKEYDARTAQFWREGARHVQLTFGSVAIALLIGLPLALVCFYMPKIRVLVLQVLSLAQTIPSLALFGLLMAPLAYLAAHSELAARMGIQGIGAAPALVALVIYNLLPVVANTVAGLNSVPAAVTEAGYGMGLTRGQMLAQIELPLALPIILTGIRVMLVQAIGLVTVAALVGGGGFGVFVFQGIGQTATDLVLLGALPTVLLAFCAAVVLDAVIDGVKTI